MSGVFEVFRDGRRRWRWRLVSEDGVIVATSPTTFGSMDEVEVMLRGVMESASEAPTIALDG